MIRNNIEKLMEFTEYEELMEACLKHQLLYDPMRDQIEVQIIIHVHDHDIFLLKNVISFICLSDRQIRTQSNATEC